MKIYNSRNSVFDAVNAVINSGIAVIEGTKSAAVAHANRVIECLKPYKNIAPIIGFQEDVPKHGYLYYVFDDNRFSLGDIKLKELVLRIADENPIDV